MILIRGLVAAAEAASELPLRASVQAVVEAIDDLVAEATSFADDVPLLRFVVRLGLAPRTMTSSELAPLREAGFSDREIHDVVNVVACFSYMNRLADGLGVDQMTDPSTTVGAWAIELLGEGRAKAHQTWTQR